MPPRSTPSCVTSWNIGLEQMLEELSDSWYALLGP